MAARTGQNLVSEQFMGQSGGAGEYWGMQGTDGFPSESHEQKQHRLQPYTAPHVPEGQYAYKEGDHKPYVKQFHGKVVDSEEEVSHWTEPVVAGWLASLEVLLNYMPTRVERCPPTVLTSRLVPEWCI